MTARIRRSLYAHRVLVSQYVLADAARAAICSASPNRLRSASVDSALAAERKRTTLYSANSPSSIKPRLTSSRSSVEARLTDNDGHLTLTTHHLDEVHAWLVDRIQPSGAATSASSTDPDHSST